MRRRFLMASLVIVLCTGTAVASAIVLELDTLLGIFHRAKPTPYDPGLEPAKAGKPQTILLLGSDRRFADRRTGTPARSDSMLLLHLDPQRHATAVLSIPRDLEVQIPGHGRNRINTAYALGGTKLTRETVSALLARSGRDVPINHVVDVNFGGFRRVVDQLGCVYADVDRRYFNDNHPPYESPTDYAVIDLKPGYQRLCGADALSYVRFRHLDDDFVRSARQQEFLRQAKQQVGVGRLFSRRRALLDTFARSARTDLADASKRELRDLVQLVFESSRRPVREIRFPGTTRAGSGAVTVSDGRLATAVRRFIDGNPPTGAGRGAGHDGKGSGAGSRLAPGLVRAAETGEQHVTPLAQRVRDLPVYFPSTILGRGGYVSSGPVPGEPAPRSYRLLDPDRRPHRAYRIELSTGLNGQYYGVQGTTWKDPPILRDPTDEVRVGGRTFARYFDGGRLRLVAWRPERARGVYWVSNTLSQQLSNRQMMGIAGSLRPAS